MKRREKWISSADLPVAVESDSGVSQDSKHETDGRPGVAIDTEKAALLRVLPSRAGDDDEVSRPSWMHRLQFHGLKEKHDEISGYSGPSFSSTIRIYNNIKAPANQRTF